MAEADLFAVFNEIGIINQLVTTQLERKLPDGLKLAHFGVLNHLVRRGGEPTPAELARAFEVTKGAMTNTLGRLATRDLIRVRTNPDDGRSKLVTITAKGARARAEAIKALAPMFAELAKQIPLEKIEAVLPVLQQLRVILDEARNESGKANSREINNAM